MRNAAAVSFLVLSIVATMTAAAWAQEDRPASTQPQRAAEDDEPRTPAAAYGKLLTMLTEEGERAAEELTLPRAHASVAAEFPYELPMARVGRAVIERQHRNDLVDAYIRWQLTSFDPPLPELPTRRFERVLADLPALAVNPRADEDLIRLLNRALQAGELSASDQQQINERIERMNELQSQRRELNRPALELREWLAEQHADSIALRIMVAVERCGALVRGGWPIGAFGGQAEELFEQASRDRDLDAGDRRRVAAFAGRFAGLERVYVRSARINENRVVVNYANTAIYDFDVRRWLRRMDGK